MSKKKIIPPLSLAISDTGDRYMVGHHRYAMFDRFGLSRNEYPKGLAAQREFLKHLKAEDPEKYNAEFDIIVRGVEPKAEVKVVDLPPELLDQAKAELFKILDDIKTSLPCEIEKQIAEAAKVLNKVEIEYTVKQGQKNKKINGPLPDEFQKILDLASQRINILLVGPSGCGKTHVAKVVAETLGLDFAAQSCSAGMSESAFTGWLLPIGDSGKFQYVQSEFVRIYENGGVFLFDEIDAADSNTMLFLNQALANGEFYLPQRHEKPKVVKHKDFVCIAAANTFGNGATALYSGRNLMDGATMDRFRMGIVPMDYSPTVEQSLIDPEVLAWGRMMRNVIETKSMRKILSTRLLIDASKMKSIGWTIDEIENSYIADWSREEKAMLVRDPDYLNHKSQR